MSPRVRWLAALLPLVGLVALVVRSELAQRGAELRLRISGYDPRDLIAGQYLRYRYELDWQGESSCGVGSPGSPAPAGAEPGLRAHDPNLSSGCCVCFTRPGEPTSSPAARQVSCEEARRCAGWLYAEQLLPPQRYYVPEDRALELERALAARKAAVDVVTSPSGTAAVGELYLDGLPWRIALEQDPPPAP